MGAAMDIGLVPYLLAATPVEPIPSIGDSNPLIRRQRGMTCRRKDLDTPLPAETPG